MKKQIIFVDPSVQNYQSLIQNTPDSQIIILKENYSGIAQITQALAHQKNIEALHIISHGSPGSLYLGTTELNSSNIGNYSQQFQQWRNALTSNASIILYGCNVAAGDTGHQFLAQLHQLTGANIAANSQPTGNSKKGGTWDIAQLIPPSPQRPKLALTETSLKSYRGLLGFNPKFDFATGTGPYSVSIGDINGDGKPDLAVANRNSNSVSILLNTTATGATTPTFNPKVDFAAGTNTRSVSIGDFNGDGKPDLAVENYFGNSVSILLNTTATGATTPTFNPKVDFATGSRPRSVSIGDINGDGKPDLAVANRFGNSVSILLNTTATGATTPTFNPKVDFTTGDGPSSVTIGDINGDSKPDLAVANASSNSASILLNTTATGATTPTFNPKVDFATGTGPYSVSIGDINGDGKPDLAVANRFSNSASILLNTTATGATTPTFNPKVDFATGTNPFSVSIGDINGDGFPDLAVANTSSNSASILLNTTATGATTPTFNPKVDFATGSQPASISIGDINGDGKPDLATANFSSNSVSILLNNTPKVTSVTATNTDNSYGVGSTIAITVTFEAAVTVDTTGGTPQLQLETGTIDRFATYSSGSGSTVLTFNYVVQPGDTSADLEYLATTAFTLNGGTIKDNLTANADLTLPTLATANSLGGSKAIVIETVAPTVTLTSTSAATVNSPFTVTATFSEDVIGFDNTDLTVSNGTISNFTIIDAKTYSFDVTPTTDGNVTVDIPANQATDTAGNNNTAATQLTRTADITAPTVTLKSPSSTTVNSAFTVTATFSENVTGFNNTDITVGNATVSNFVTVDGKTYTFDVTPTADGNVTVDIPTAKATDTAGNNNTAATQLTRTADFTAPTVTLTSTSAATVNSAFTVTATFSENVTGFNNTDINVGNATVSNFVTVDGKTYTFDVTPTADGNVTVDVLAAKAIDTAGNNNTAATQLTRTADFTAPTVTLTSPSSTTVNSAFTVTATFSENVTGFDNPDLTVSNGTVSNFVKIDGKTYTFDVTPTTDGNVTVDVLASKATDTAGNNNTAATQLTRTNVNIATPTPTPTPLVTPTPTPSVTPTPTPSVTPTPTPSVTPTPTPSVTPTPTPSVTPTPTPSVTPTPTPSVTPTPTPSVTPTPTPSVTPTPTPSVTPTPTPSVTPTPTPSEPETPTPTPIINNTPNDTCVCALIEYPNLNQPNEVENTIFGTYYFQVGTEGNDLFLGSNFGNIFDAKSGNDNSYSGDSRDIINGNFGRDFISGGKGDDILLGDEDNDIILGDFGQDLIFGGKRADSLHGREDDDIIFGNRNDDFLDGGKGNDVLYGGKGKDITFGSQGNDSLFGSQENDSICGGVGDDFLSGNEQEDLLGGCEGNDTIYGGENNDTLMGCQGDDILYGDLGNDSLIGGSGKDVFVLKAGQGFDTIGDFTVGQDSIGLSGGLSFSQLEFTENDRGTIIKNLLTGEQLAITIAVSKSVLTSASFLLV